MRLFGRRNCLRKSFVFVVIVENCVILWVCFYFGMSPTKRTNISLNNDNVQGIDENRNLHRSKVQNANLEYKMNLNVYRLKPQKYVNNKTRGMIMVSILTI